MAIGVITTKPSSHGNAGKRMKKTLRRAFAIVRFDKFLGDISPPPIAITVKKVVLTQEAAESEVCRLNTLNRDKSCLYFWQRTRFVNGHNAPMP